MIACGGYRVTRVNEYYQTPDGRKIPIGEVKRAIRQNDWKALAKYSRVLKPESIDRVAGKQTPLAIFAIGPKTEFAGKKYRYLKIGGDPVKPGGWNNEDLPQGWFWTSLPGDVLTEVTTGSGRKVSGLLARGEQVAIYLVVKNGQPVKMTENGTTYIQVQVGAVKRCANRVLNEILIWLPLGFFQKIYESKIYILEKVKEIYFEKDNDWLWWLVGAGAVLGVVGGYLIGRNQGNDGGCPSCDRPKPPPKPKPGPKPPSPPPPKPPPPNPPTICPPTGGPAPRPGI